jgi:hypothetical protein
MAKLYKEMAQTLSALQHCILSANREWEMKHEQRMADLLNELPHGSGLNGEWHYDLDKCTTNRIVLSQIYETMTDSGYYDTVVDFTLTIKPSLLFDIQLSIIGNFGKYADIKEYLYDILNESLTREIVTE